MFCPLPLLLLLLALPAAGQAEDYTYATNNGTITITGYNGPGGAVTIPDTTNALPVTSVGDGYPGVFEYKANLISVTIPNSVTRLGDGAFSLCTSLINVTISRVSPTSDTRRSVAAPI